MQKVFNKAELIEKRLKDKRDATRLESLIVSEHTDDQTTPKRKNRLNRKRRHKWRRQTDTATQTTTTPTDGTLPACSEPVPAQSSLERQGCFHCGLMGHFKNVCPYRGRVASPAVTGLQQPQPTQSRPRSATQPVQSYLSPLPYSNRYPR